MEQLDSLSQHIGFASDGTQYLTFRLGTEDYGIDILRVQEIKGYSSVTPIPNTPPYVKGVMNLRGTIIPVVDLRSKFTMAATEYNQFTVIIVVTVGPKTFGLVVDGVSDVLNIPRADIQPMPDIGAEVDARFISGMAKAADRLIILLDIDRVLVAEQTDGARAATARRPPASRPRGASAGGGATARESAARG